MPTALETFGRSPGLVAEVARRAQRWLGWKGGAEFDVEKFVSISAELCNLNRAGLRQSELAFYLAWSNTMAAGTSILRWENSTRVPQTIDHLHYAVHSPTGGTVTVEYAVTSLRSGAGTPVQGSYKPELLGGVLTESGAPFLRNHLGVDVPPPAGSAFPAYLRRVTLAANGSFNDALDYELVIPPGGELRVSYTGILNDVFTFFASGQEVDVSDR